MPTNGNMSNNQQPTNFAARVNNNSYERPVGPQGNTASTHDNKGGLSSYMWIFEAIIMLVVFGIFVYIMLFRDKEREKNKKEYKVVYTTFCPRMGVSVCCQNGVMCGGSDVNSPACSSACVDAMDDPRLRQTGAGCRHCV